MYIGDISAKNEKEREKKNSRRGKQYSKFGPRRRKAERKRKKKKERKKIHGTLSRSILHTCKHANVLFCKTLLLTMVIFVLLIWLWVWCNAVAGYFVPLPPPPSSFPSSFHSLLSRRTRDVTLIAKSASNDVARRRPRPPIHPSDFISHDDFRSINETHFSTHGYLYFSRYERRNESVTRQRFVEIGFAAAPPTTLDLTATLLARSNFLSARSFFISPGNEDSPKMRRID